jgi:RimJ/RimL family protein N-acetyltransferase
MKLEAPPAPRVEIVQATAELLEAERQDPHTLAAALQAELPADWPPEHHDEQTIAHALEALKHPENFGWGTHYFLARDPRTQTATLAGVGGYTGAPQHGTVEIGYSVVPSQQRKGIATKAAQLLAETAFNRGVDRIIANTLPHLIPSIGVLTKLGFSATVPTAPEVVTFELRRKS